MDKFLVKGGYSGSPSYKGRQYLHEGISISVVTDSSLPWLTETVVQWRHLTLPVPVTMSSESSAPRALISISGRHSWHLVPHVSCPIVLSSMWDSSSSLCLYTLLSKAALRPLCQTVLWAPKCDSCAHCIGGMSRLEASLLEPAEAILMLPWWKFALITTAKKMGLCLQVLMWPIPMILQSLVFWLFSLYGEPQQSETTLVFFQMRSNFCFFSEKMKHNMHAPQRVILI